nr:leucine-rich repeat protein [uncultured Oscillibacter sp.]
MKNRYVRALAIALACCMTLLLFPVTAAAATIEDSGYCGGEGDGTNLRWTLDSDGLLTISGVGEMDQYLYSSTVAVSSHFAPWYSDDASANKVIRVKIDSGVTSIGDYAFFKCSNLMGITIPESVQSIGKYAFYGCKALKSISLPDGIKSIGDCMFYGCNNLADFRLPDSVTSIGVEAFRWCSKLPNITLPDGLTSIGHLAFEYCPGLTSIRFPDSITYIGSGAFGYCGNLESACFCGNGDIFFAGTFPGHNKWFTIYYIKGKTGWTDSTAYNAEEKTWHSIPLRTWDGKNIPIAAKLFVPGLKYCIRVIDENNTPIASAKVTWDSQSAYTDQDGNVFFDASIVGTPVIEVSKSGYITWTNQDSDWQKNDRRFEKVVLYPTSSSGLKLKTAKVKTKEAIIIPAIWDVLTETKVLSLINDGALIGDFNYGRFDLTCKATNASDAVCYSIYQNDKKIRESTDGEFSELSVEAFSEGGGCFIRVTGKDGKEVDTHINLQFAKNSVNKDTGIQFKGNKVSIAVSDDVPYVGGSTIGFEVPIEMPVVVNLTDDKFEFGLNVKLNDTESVGEQLKDYKSLIQKAAAAGKYDFTQKYAKKIKKLAAKENKADFFKKVTFTFCGYAEAPYGCETASGYLMVIANCELANIEYNTVLWVLPVTIQIGLDMDMQGGITTGYQLDTDTWTFNGILNFLFKLDTFGGLGCSKIIGLGAYGDADLDIKWNVVGTESGLKAVDLTGELGIKGYIGWLEAQKAFAHQTWHLYTPNSVRTLSLQSGDAAWDDPFSASDLTVSDLGYLEGESDWAPETMQLLSAGAATSYQTLLENTYRNAQPVMVSDGNALYAAFIRADEESGARYIVVTKSDGTSWQPPVRVDADSILDDAPQLCTDESGNLWLAYAQTAADPDGSLLTYARNQSIVVGTIDKETLAFTKQETYCSGTYLHLPALKCVNGTPVLAWADSVVTDENSVLSPDDSSVCMAQYRYGAWTEAETIAELSAGVDSFCIGTSGDEPTVAYISDGTLYCDGTTLAENVIGEAVFGRLPGTENDAFIWNAEGALHNSLSEDTVPAEGMGREFAIVGNHIYYNMSNGANANLAVLQYDPANSRWGAPICLIGDEKYLENMSVAALDGDTYAFGMHTTVTITQDDVIDSKDLVWTRILPVSDLRIQNVDFDSSMLVPGETVPVTITVYNAGDHEVTSLEILADDSLTASQNCSILPGESKELTIDITCPDDKQTIRFAVQEPGEDDYTPENNEMDCTIGSADVDLELSFQQVGSQKSLLASVVNRGLETASGSILFSDSNGQIIAERTFENLTGGGVVVAEYVPESFDLLMGEDVTATVRLHQDEWNTLDNSDTVPVLIPVNEITDAYLDGDMVRVEVTCMKNTDTKVLCAFYDQFDRMLGADTQIIQTGKSEDLSFIIKYPDAAKAKLFVLDGNTAPVCENASVVLKN